MILYEGTRDQVSCRKIRNSFILLVNPSLGTKRYAEEDILRSYLSLGTLASALENKAFLRRFFSRLGKQEFIFDSTGTYPDFEIRVLNLSLKPKPLSNRKYLADFLNQVGHTPLMICMTATSAQLDEAEDVAQAAKQLFPDAVRIIGGPHVSVAAADYLERSEFQVACIGEGLETLCELALFIYRGENSDYSTIAGIIFKDRHARIQTNSIRTPLLELDAYPFPSDSLNLFWKPTRTPAENEPHLIYVLSGYGCPNDCIFCAQRAIHGQKIRERSAENIFEEIKALFAKGFRRFAFVQETFLNRKRRIGAFCRLIENAAMDIEWTVEARADQLEYVQLKRMRSAGLRFIQIGVESGDPALLKKIGKNLLLDQVIQVRRWCNELKINTAFYLLVGLPGQNWQSIFRSALFFREHPPYNRFTKHASVSIAIPYPGTRMWAAQTVRLIEREKKRLSWPERNPEVSVDDTGAFVGQNATETDDLTAGEIFEAWIYLDDCCHFLLHAMDPDHKDPADRTQSMEYASRMFYMIQRRTIRDLIIRAQPDLTTEKRKSAYAECLRLDADAEIFFKDVTAVTEPASEVFDRFLARVRFLNGFQTMKWIGVANRIKWMKICAMIWHLGGKKMNDFRFEIDSRKTGIVIEKRMQPLRASQLNQYITQLDAGAAAVLFADISISEEHLHAFGFTFHIGPEMTVITVIHPSPHRY